MRRVALNTVDSTTSEISKENVAFDKAFRRLEQREPEAADVVRLRFFED
jgi:hypothetical protein